MKQPGTSTKAEFTAVQQFNKGSSAFVNVIVELELTASNVTTQFVEQADTNSVEAATRKSSEKEKKKAD